MKTIQLASISIACLMLTSCGGKKPEEPPPPALEKTFAFTETNTVVKAAELEAKENDNRSLRADFNQDGLNDIAIIRTEGDVQNAVDIYIRQPPAAQAAGDAPAEAVFFRGGTIRRPVDGKIKALASKEEAKVVNIVMMITYTNQPTEWIHYRNDGKSFTEVQF